MTDSATVTDTAAPYERATDELRQVRRLLESNWSERWEVVSVQRKWLVQDGPTVRTPFSIFATPSVPDGQVILGLSDAPVSCFRDMLIGIVNPNATEAYRCYDVISTRTEWRDLPSVTETAAHAEEEATRG